MDTVKHAHVITIRANTVYPTYRAYIGIITVIWMILAGLQALGAIVGGLTLMRLYGFLGFIILLVGLAFAALNFFLAKAWNEFAQILADIGDAVMETNARTASDSAPTRMPPTY